MNGPVAAGRVFIGGGADGPARLDAARCRTIWQMLCDSAARFPERSALVGAEDAGTVRQLTYAALVERAQALSGGLASIGVRRGDRVVLWMTNTLEWIVASQAVMRLGAALVPVNTFLKPAEIAYVLAQSGARHLIMLDRFRKLDFAALLGDMCPAFAGAGQPGNLCDPALPDLRNVVLWARGGQRHAGAFDFAELEDQGRADPAARAQADALATGVTPSEIAMVKYTSGSTGFPKGVCLEQGGVVANGLFHGERIGATGDDVFFSMMPFFHGGGSIWGQMTMLPIGGRLVFTEAFDAEGAVDLIAAERATIQFGVLAKEVAEAARGRGVVLDSLRIGHAPPGCEDVFPNARFCPTPFGLTEAYGPVALNGPDDPAGTPPGAGRLLPGQVLRVINPATGADAEPGDPGEAWLKGNVMRGYWDKPDENARMFTADGWLKSEDLVTVDEQGFVAFAGRIKLMLKVGGENVSIEEVENLVESHPGVAECTAVGVPDPRKQEAVRAYVVAASGQPADAQALSGWLATRLAKFKQPRDVIYVEALPRLANGKRDRVTVQGWADAEAEGA